MFTGLLMILMAAVGYPRGEKYLLDLTDVEPLAVAALGDEVVISAEGYNCTLDIDADGVLCVAEGCEVNLTFPEYEPAEYAAFALELCVAPLMPWEYVWVVCYDPLGSRVEAQEVWLDGFGGFCGSLNAQHPKTGGFAYCTFGPGCFSNLVVELPEDYD